MLTCMQEFQKSKSENADNQHCKDCVYSNSKNAYCSKYRMITAPYKWCKNCKPKEESDNGTLQS